MIETFPDDEWQELGVPGLSDTAEVARTRLDFLRRFQQEFPGDLDGLPFKVVERVDPSLSHSALEQLQEAYDVRPSWVPVFVGESLPFWQGALAWILDLDKEDQRVVAVQVPQGTSRAAYSIQETLSHELAHAARLSLDEPKYEEFFTYRLSPKWWRRGLGPFFTAPWEASAFLVLCFLSVLLSFWLPAAVWLLPVALGMGLMRLAWRRITLELAGRALRPLCHDERSVWCVLFRLTDAEIHEFSRMYPEQCLNLIRQRSLSEWRWQQISARYLVKV